MKKFALFDIDGTLIRWQLYHALGDELAKLGLIDKAEYAAIQAARMEWKKRTYSESFKDYEGKLVVAYHKALETLSVKAFEQAAQTVFEEYKDQVYTYTRDLLKELKQQGYMLLAISGSQQEIISKVAAYYGFDDFVGTEYGQVGDRFTGDILYHAKDKRKILHELVNKHDLSFEGSIAVGDSMTDVPALEMVERPIAFNPEKKLFDIARKHGWKIVIERKNMIYELESRDGRYLLG